MSTLITALGVAGTLAIVYATAAAPIIAALAQLSGELS